jgi:hypothetical protein
MPDDRSPPSSIFTGLPKPVVRPEPAPAAPAFQVSLSDLHGELDRIGHTLAQATPDTFDAVMGAIMPALDPLLNASAMSLSERVAAVERIHGSVLAETISAAVLRIEIQRFLTIFVLDPVALCPAVAQARAEAEANEPDDDNDPADA